MLQPVALAWILAAAVATGCGSGGGSGSDGSETPSAVACGDLASLDFTDTEIVEARILPAAGDTPEQDGQPAERDKFEVPVEGKSVWICLQKKSHAAH